MSQMVTQISSAHSPEALFETLHLDIFRPAELRLALLLGLASSRWRQPWRGSAKLLDAVRALRSRLARDPLWPNGRLACRTPPHPADRGGGCPVRHASAAGLAALAANSPVGPTNTPPATPACGLRGQLAEL